MIIKLILIIPVVWVLQSWLYLILPDRFQCRKCTAFWLALPLVWVPQPYLEWATIPSVIALIYYLVDTYTSFFNPTIRL
jgi:hypothetical protein